ncbi:unnamed protein product [Porites lobata]|uniref:Uncharacterized protein n=1 Tax=Porites lobata TaxID=104759 RepID=A0ABN8PAE2_9CNID|nr:unnamed protein product [Porites lobata]
MIWKLREAGNSSAMSVRDRCMAMKHILAEHKARNVATSQEHEDDPEFDSPASGESAMLTNQILMRLEREPDSDEIEEMEEEVEEYAVTDPLPSSNSLQVEKTTESTPTDGSVHADMDTGNSLSSSSSMVRDFFYFKEKLAMSSVRVSVSFVLRLHPAVNLAKLYSAVAFAEAAAPVVSGGF